VYSVAYLLADSGTDYWSSNQGANTDFISRITERGRARGVSMGIYTSYSQWSPITGNSNALSGYPLWYPHYDNNPSYSDWSPFGGWSKPAIKQYQGTTTVCSAGVDLNYY
jgi:GH25 family lysozyme M1 (1,4-beta-N-acetylmuramidase)